MSRLMSAMADLLIRRQLVLEGVLELLLPVRVGAEGVARNRLARGVELQQLLGHVAHGLLDRGLRALPRRAAQPIDRRPRRAGVLLDQVEPLDRDEQLVVAGVAQLEELLACSSPTPICFSPTNMPMPWSTWTTRSPTFRSRRSDRNALVAERAPLRARGAPLRRRRPRRRSAAPASGSRKPRDSLPMATSTAAYRASSARSTGTARTSYSLSSSIVRSARPGVAATNSVVSPCVAQLPDLGDPVRHAAVHLDGWLAPDVARRAIARRRRARAGQARSPARAGSAPGRRSRRRVRGSIGARGGRDIRARGRAPAPRAARASALRRRSWYVAGSSCSTQLRRVRCRPRRRSETMMRRFGARESGSRRTSARTVVRQDVAQRDDGELIDRARSTAGSPDRRCAASRSCRR